MNVPRKGKYWSVEGIGFEFFGYRGWYENGQFLMRMGEGGPVYGRPDTPLIPIVNDLVRRAQGPVDHIVIQPLEAVKLATEGAIGHGDLICSNAGENTLTFISHYFRKKIIVTLEAVDSRQGIEPQDSSGRNLLPHDLR
jgi:hypothetical protein